ncbi:MAG: glycosyltransferase [SAR324 cluster bacterium]|uniref:Glycosyltransferase n=1 Tax=SAR324 cluster bacterium TaxID=2024889 RepID=A0A7X9FR96_9DELT|nr:glycosyltransferase [SAR324 cluster bacterium]
MKVLYVYQPAAPYLLSLEQRLITRISKETRHKVELWNWAKEYGISSNPMPDWAEQNRAQLADFHKELKKRAAEVDCVLIAQTGAIPPDIMSELPARVVYNTADDPDSSTTSSFPYLKSADIIAHAGVNFNATTRMGDEFKKRGAKRTILFPIGFYEEQFPTINDLEEQNARRDIDLVYIGHLKRGRLDEILRRYPQMVVHGRSLKLKHKLWLLVHGKRWVGPYNGNLAELYARTKVGINIHFSYGPSNTRCYQLNACGVAQVLDCPEGSSEFYQHGKEVMIYSNMKEAAQQIDELLKNDELRNRIALNGYHAARARFTRFRTFSRLLDEVEQD